MSECKTLKICIYELTPYYTQMVTSKIRTHVLDTAHSVRRNEDLLSDLVKNEQRTRMLQAKNAIVRGFNYRWPLRKSAQRTLLIAAQRLLEQREFQ